MASHAVFMNALHRTGSLLLRIKQIVPWTLRLGTLGPS